MESPYQHSIECVSRLLREYYAHKGRLILALDFDDTVFDYHNAGHSYDWILGLVRCAQAARFYIMLFTGTPRAQWDAQCAYLQDRGIHVDSVNANPIALPFGNDGKPYYNLLLDDRAGLGQGAQILNQLLTEIENGGERDENIPRHRS